MSGSKVGKSLISLLRGVFFIVFLERVGVLIGEYGLRCGCRRNFLEDVCVFFVVVILVLFLSRIVFGFLGIFIG